MLFKRFQCYNSSLPKRVYSKNIRSYGHSAEQVSCFTIDQFEDVVMCHLKTDDKTISATYMSTPSLPDPGSHSKECLSNDIQYFLRKLFSY